MLDSANVPKLVRAFCIATAVISVLLYIGIKERVDPGYDLWQLVSLTSMVSALLVFAFLSGGFTRMVWRCFSWLSPSVYPNLHGLWEGMITPHVEGAFSDPLPFRAVIRQTIYTTELDFFGSDFHSTTISATPKTDHGQHHLMYVYRATPGNPSFHEYTGTARLVVTRPLTEGGPSIQMTGTYVTDRLTIGRIVLNRVNSKTGVPPAVESPEHSGP